MTTKTKKTFTRTDIHRPGAINPADYDFVGIEHDRHPGGIAAIEYILAQRARIQAHMARTGGTYSGHQHKGNCMVCGAHCVYTALFYHPPTNAYVRTGFDCAEKMGVGDPALFRTHKKMMADIMKARAGKAKARAILRNAHAEGAWMVHLSVTDLPALAKAMSLHPDCPEQLILDYAEENEIDGAFALRVVAEAKAVTYKPLPFEERTISDIVEKIIKYGNASEKQLNFVRGLVGRIEQRPERQQKIAAEKAKASDAPDGDRITAEFEVVKVEWKADSNGGYHDDVGRYVMVVKHAKEGWAAWGSVPKGLREIPSVDAIGQAFDRVVEKGERIELTATFQRSERDAKFAFFSRPFGKLVEGSAPDQCPLFNAVGA